MQRKVVIRTIQKIAKLIAVCLITFSIGVFGALVGDALLKDSYTGVIVIGAIVGVIVLVRVAYADAKFEVELERERLMRELKKDG